MKDYSERLPMIDEAIEAYNGKWPLLEDRGLLHFAGPKSEVTRQEFEQRAKELGYINGYKWGVEYPTNGEKPDLPDDVEVEFYMGDASESIGFDNAGSWHWDCSSRFRIVDERYKTKEPDTNSQEPLDSSSGQPEVGDWNGEGLPPAGTVVEYIVGERKGYLPCAFVGVNSRGSLVIEAADGEYLSYHSYQIKFRPLRTEREKLHQELLEIIESNGNLSNGILADTIIDAGYRKLVEVEL